MPLVAPEGMGTRPITDRAKQSLFDALQDCFAGADGAVGGVVLDCFAGPGSLGLECLSRGARRAIFVERDRRALKALKHNIGFFKVEERSLVLPMDAYLAADNAEVRDLTIAFVDPPYSHTDTGHERAKVDELLRKLAAGCMVDGGIISFRHPAHVSIDAAALGVRVVRELRYGEMGITWLVKA